MRHTRIISATALVGALTLMGAVADPAPPSAQDALETRFDAAIHPSELDAWMKLLAAEPNQVGSPHDKSNAEYVLAQFKSWGWDAHIETFDVLYPTPISEAVELLGKKPFKATLQEPPIKGDSSARAHDYALPAYVAYQGDGDVTAGLVYANYGMPDDYKALKRMGIDVKGKIVITRYGAGWRGLKPKLAQEHGAIGCLIYSDPAEDGYGTDAAYPNGPARPPHGIQRGSVQDMTFYPGDPLTPGVGATKDAKRLTRETAPTILKIPTLPISYADAQVLLASLGGDVVPKGWRGALPITYRVGPGTAQVHLLVKSDWSLKTIYDVIAVMKGSDFPDQWVVRGNHRDGWVFGASDPLSGQVALMAEGQAIGGLVKAGWHPKRTLVYASWDAEEPGLIGSTEWAEAHADELKQKAVIYINTDGNGRGLFSVGGSHDLERLVNGVADSVIDPETHVSIGARHRAQMRIAALAGDAKPEVKVDAKLAADPSMDFPLEPLGSGSDYTVFAQHLGIASLNVGFGGEGEAGGVYHSRYDTYEHHSRFVDPGFVYDALLAKTVGRLVLRVSESGVPVLQAGDFAERMATYFAELKKLETTEREEAATQAKLLSDHAFELSADPTKTSGVPDALDTVPPLTLKPLEDAITRLKTSAAAYDAAIAKNGAGLSPEKRAALGTMMRDIDQTLLNPAGLPGRPWFLNMIYAPGRLTGYGAKTLPGVRESIEDRHWSDADKYAALTAAALNAYSDRLDKATALLTAP
ncbi:MAG TPA: transferrin receptor-like dimerization domain-containing protein [Rhizomicrobium sp.]|jgi:N-acetylated-alpha-linked acidic dipeptidase|nr:transferrin receptor-like dimerization domain-containing protein [Rhizomicrobium sp.]